MFRGSRNFEGIRPRSGRSVVSSSVGGIGGEISLSFSPKSFQSRSFSIKNRSEIFCNFSARDGTHFVVSRGFHSSGANRNLVNFKLADIGEGIAECELLKWHVKEGDQIAEFQLLCEVQSDKADVEITSRYSGVVHKLHYKKGDMVKVGANLMDIEVAGGESKPQAATPSVPQATPSHNGEKAINQHVLTSPAVRYIAAKHKIDLSRVTGSGRDGRIQKGDILGLVNGAQEVSPAVPVAVVVPVAPPAAPVAPIAQFNVPKFSTTVEDKVVPLSGYSRTMVKTMTIANQIPHFGYNDEVIVDKLQEYRQMLKPIAAARGVKLSNMPIIIKATSMALLQFPRLNSSYDEANNAMIYKGAHNIGVAVDTPIGLVVPNIKNVQSKSIFEIAQELNRIQASAKISKVSKEDLSGGTFTLSNIGSIGGTYASPVIVLPEVAIGAIGKIQRLPRFDDKGNVIPVQIFNISWAADHRVIDGATMANFSNLWKQYLENPSAMLFDAR